MDYFVYLDTETTGLEKEDEIVQLAFMSNGTKAVGLFKPKKKIEIEAMATHHITEKMVEKAPVFEDSEIVKQLNACIASGGIIVAHNADFDVGFLKRQGIEVGNYICSWKLSNYLDTEGKIKSHALQYLRYLLGIEVEASAHDAMGDVLVLEAVFKRMYDKMFAEIGNHDDVVKNMIEITDKPILLKRMPFGKHKGKMMEDVPYDYLEWLSGTDMDENMAYTVDYYMKN